MFHATAKALRSAADQRAGDGALLLTAQVEDVAIVGEGAEEHFEAMAASSDVALLEAGDSEAPTMGLMDAGAIDAEAMRILHDEFRWSESKLMQASERLAEAQEARRKDLVALACMRRELRGSFAAERAYVEGQLALFGALLPKLQAHEGELAALVEGGARTVQVIADLAEVRAERKLVELAGVQGTTQLARIDDSECTLEYEVANEAYDLEPDGRTMRELARLRAAQTKAHRVMVRMRGESRDAIARIGIDTTHGEVAAIGAFLASEFEGDARAHQRVEAVRAAQVAAELKALPEPTANWKAGLRHPVSFMRSRKAPSLRG
jgi:hypothetical protein